MINMRKLLTEDNLRCVLLIISSTFTSFSVDGFITSVSVIKQLWLENEIGSLFALDWILSCMQGGCFLFSPFVNLLTKRLGFRATMILGGYLAGCSIFAASFSSNYWVLLVVLGFVTTFSLAMQILTCILCVSVNFEEKRPVAMGIVTCGTGMGITVFSIIIGYLENLYPWNIILIFLACINLQAVVFGGLMKSRSNDQRAQEILGSLNHLDQFNLGSSPNLLKANMKQPVMLPNVFIGSSAALSCSSIEKLDLNTATVTDLLQLDNQSMIDINQMMGTLGSLVFINKLNEYFPGITRREKGGAGHRTIWKSPIFLFTMSGTFFLSLSCQMPITYLVKKMTDLGFEKIQISYVFASYGIINSCCRVLTGLFASSKLCNVIYCITLIVPIFAINLAVPWMHKLFHFFIFSSLFAVGQGSTMVLFPLTVAKVVPVKDLTNALSIQLFVMGCGFLIGLPIAGSIFVASKSYLIAYGYSTLLVLLSFISFATASIIHYSSEHQERLRKAMQVQVHGIDTSKI